ncbi:MAG TPA: glycosyltransferase [Xanthobacteraceae bacterium]|nr:glycosyltransferase [Xanthobacteraceae bacterium]HUN99143.1 glycosyltransferase [Bradyrhizobium sp.]
MSNSSLKMLSGFIAPRIEPVPAGIERPLWSVMIPTFNRTEYLRRTLESVLAQDPGRDKMQIEVVDNCSTSDDPEPVVSAVAGDRITFTRNSQNLGLMRNFNRCIERAHGNLIHILHSDDYVEPTFYSVIGDLAERYPNCGFLATRVFFVDESEVIIGVTPRVKWMENPTWDVTPMLSTQYFQCAGVVVRRELYERCGGFIPELVYTGDWEMWVRTVHCGSAVVHPHPLANYRKSAGYETGRLARSGENIRDYLRLSAHLSGYPGFSPTTLPDAAALQALDQYYRFIAEGDVAAAQANLQAYKDVVPFPAWAISGALNRIRHLLQNVSRFAEKTTRRIVMPRSQVKLYRD